ncbi:electron transfer flavoprotein subunit alpha/FixB family protein [Modicisalibacter luteus]|uniref:Electron transfer flavoprotein subunit alpha/FixB family protein n=1 Tax=Modicisalibacter luteus TaxID=453962 RepID=A0ABV7LYB2_9GAMM|nr:FAD-binding protein [Halomonas lutea]GHB01482.1 electron transfer flavoprotein subunit alpha [Halomonas lutea]
MSILIVADHHENKLAEATAHVVNAAQQIGADIDILVAGEQVEAVAEAAASLDGVRTVLKADHAVYAHQLAEPMAELINTLVADYTHLLAGSSTTGKNILPRVAALRGVPQVSDIIAVESAETFKRPIYAGGAVATVSNNAPLKVVTVRASAFDAVEASGKADIKPLETAVDNALSAFVSEERAANQGPELGSARVVISGGRGLGSGENFKLLDGVAETLGAAIGASRAAVDAGYVSNDMQVGQTGKVVAPELYIAVGISGAIQHLAGMKDSRVIVAINNDEDAPIFKVADYGLVGDLFEVLPEFERQLTA